ncbi:MAG: DUF721 domain-containing protein [Bacteroidota bacterium]
MRNQNDSSLGDIIRQLTEEYRLKDKLDQVSVQRIWESALGTAISRNTKEVTFKKGALKVRIASASLRQELEIRKTEIIAKLNEELGSELVKEISFC